MGVKFEKDRCCGLSDVYPRQGLQVLGIAAER